jgi:hypothetical protein
MCRRIVAAHAKGALQDSQACCIRPAPSREVLEVAEDILRGLLVVVCRQNGDEAYDEGEHIPTKDELREFVEDMRQEYVRRAGKQRDEVGHEDGMPPLNREAVVQLGYS